MRVVFLGVGEAFDEEMHNNSHLLLSETKLLMDCGYAIPAQLYKLDSDPNLLDAVFISHAHADHYFGLPILFLRFWEQGRAKPLTIVTQKGNSEHIRSLTQLAYPRLYEKLTFPLDFIEVDGGDRVGLHEFQLEFGISRHSMPNLAVRAIAGGRVVAYSGDGMFTTETEKLYRQADLLIHEAYMMDGEYPGHATIEDVIQMAWRLGVKVLALAHLKRELRREKNRVLDFLQQHHELRILLPEPMDHLDVD